MNTNNIAIDVQNVYKSFKIYKDKAHTLKERVLFHDRNKYELNHVLNNVSFQVKEGEALGLIGHNGCGKSTTLKLLNKILYPDSGKIAMHGRISSLIELGAGFHPDMTGLENIYINASIFGLKKREIDRRLDKIIRFSELESYINNPVRTYSSGMYMRLAFSIAINVDADILLVDEILAVGDQNFQRKCFDKLYQIKEKGTSIVIVSHSMDQIKSICDKTIWLDNGSIRMQGPASAVCDEYTLAMNQAAEERRLKELHDQGNDNVDDMNTDLTVAKVAQQVSRFVERRGNMSTRFSYLSLQNGNGEVTTNFRYGDVMKICYSIAEYSSDIKKYNIVFVISKKDGPRCAMFESYLSYERYLSAEAFKNAVFEIDSLNLGTGDYYLDAVIWDADMNMTDNIIHVIDFTVLAPKTLGIGLVSMKNQWYIAK